MADADAHATCCEVRAVADEEHEMRFPNLRVGDIQLRLCAGHARLGHVVWYRVDHRGGGLAGRRPDRPDSLAQALRGGVSDVPSQAQRTR